MPSGVVDLAAGIFSLLFAAAFYVQISELKGVGRDYPLGLIIFITLGGLYLLIQGIRKRLSGRDTPPADAEPAAYGRVAIITAASVAYVLLVSLLGFYVASVAFLCASAMVLDDAGWGWKKSALAACMLTVIMCLAVWLGFTKLLYVPTPEGLFF
jgi:hypothetical protein